MAHFLLQLNGMRKLGYCRFRLQLRIQLARIAMVLTAASTLTLFAAQQAMACSCSFDPGASVHWPVDGATDVPVDTTIVVAIAHIFAKTRDNTVSLVTADGRDVPLEEITSLPQPWPGCGAAEFRFLRPKLPLPKQTSFSVLVKSSAGDQLTRTSFTVGTRSSVPEPPVEPALHYLSVHTRPGCSPTECSDLAELYADFGALPARPRYLTVQSSAAERGKQSVALHTLGLSAVQLSVALRLGEPCVDVRVYGVEGRPLFEARSCEPDRCAVDEIRRGSACGEPPGSGVDASFLAADSCEHPPLFVNGLMVDDPAAAEPAPNAGSFGPARMRSWHGAAGSRATLADAGTAQPPLGLHAAGGGCSVQPGVSSKSGFAFAALWLATYIRRRRRRG